MFSGFYLQSIWLCKVDQFTPLDARPQVVDLASDVTEGQVAHQGLLPGVCRLHVPCPASVDGRPSYLYVTTGERRLADTTNMTLRIHRKIPRYSLAGKI